MKEWLQNKLIKWTGVDKPNRFKKWKLSQPLWIQLLIELPIMQVMSKLNEIKKMIIIETLITGGILFEFK